MGDCYKEQTLHFLITVEKAVFQPQGLWKDLLHASVLTHHTLDDILVEISFLLHS